MPFDILLNIDTQEIETNRYCEVIAVTYEKRYLHKKADNTKLKSEMTKRNLDLMPFTLTISNLRKYKTISTSGTKKVF